MQAEVGFYYRIVPEKLSKLYYLYGFEYQPVIENIATNAFRVRAPTVSHPPHVLVCRRRCGVGSSFVSARVALYCGGLPQDVSTEYNTIQFFEERDKINDRMHQELRKCVL